MAKTQRRRSMVSQRRLRPAELLEDRRLLALTTTTFTFEDQAPTSSDSSRPGALGEIKSTRSGLEMSLTRPGARFDVIANQGLQAKPAAWGSRSIDPFVSQIARPFVINFNRPVEKVIVFFGDYGEDRSDRLVLEGFTKPGATGALVDNAVGFLTNAGPKEFTDEVLQVSGKGIRSLRVIGGTSSHPNSVFIDNVRVTFESALPDLAGTALRYHSPRDASFVKFRAPNWGGPVPANGPLVIEATIKNQGNANAQNVDVKFYVSRDASVSTADVLIGKATITLLKSGQANTIRKTFTLPAAVQATFTGRITIGVVIDSSDTVPEKSESNNANRGNGLDRGTSALYDQVPAISDLAGFNSMAEAEAYLRRIGFSRVFPIVGGSGWERKLDSALRIRTVFDGRTLPGDAFRQQAFVRSPDGFHHKWWIRFQGTPTRGEPHPNTALRFGIPWAFYAESWHAHF